MKLLVRGGFIVAAIAVIAAMASPALHGLGADTTSFINDDDIPGVPLPASPVQGTLDDTAAGLDLDDVFAVRLRFNERLKVSMTGSPNTDFDLQLWKPGSPTIHTTKPLSYIVQASSNEGTSTEQFWYPVSVTGTYSLDVVNWAGKGSYRLDWDVVTLPSPEITYTVPATVKWGGAASIVGTATMNGVGLDRPQIMIAARRFGSTGWTYLNKEKNRDSTNYGMPRTVATTQGAFTYTVYPTRLTEYRAIVWPTYDRGRANGATKLVSPRATITRPSAPTKVRAANAFAVSGYVKPKHKVGTRTVKLRFYSKNKDGSYTWRKTVWAKSYASTKRPTYTRYYRKTSLPFKGTWKVVAHIPGDSTHTAKSSSARYIIVTK